MSLCGLNPLCPVDKQAAIGQEDCDRLPSWLCYGSKYSVGSEKLLKGFGGVRMKIVLKNGSINGSRSLARRRKRGQF